MSMWKRRSMISEMTRSTSPLAMTRAFSGLSIPMEVCEVWFGRMAAWMAAAALLLLLEPFERGLDFKLLLSVLSLLLLPFEAAFLEVEPVAVALAVVEDGFWGRRVLLRFLVCAYLPGIVMDDEQHSVNQMFKVFVTHHCCIRERLLLEAP